MKIKEFQHKPVQPDTYEASMALQQLMRIAKCGMKLHNMIDNDAEMESWVAKKIDLAGDYVKKVYNYTEADKAGLYDDSGMTEDAGEKIANMAQNMTKDEFMSNADELGLTPKEAAEYYEKMQGGAYARKFEDAGEQALANELSKYYQDSADGMDPEDHGNDEHDDYEDMAQGFKKGLQAGMDQVNMAGWEFSTNDFDMNRDGKGEVHYQMADILKKYGVSAGINKKSEAYLIKDGKAITDPSHWNKRFEGMAEDAGEGHMSKSTLYHTVKYAIQLMDMIKKGDDLEGWVQSKLNKAADYLQGAANYEEYQRLNPYREELDPTLMQKHAVVIQKNIDEILDKETKLDDIDTKPGMMRILAKRVNEVEKEIAKENRKNTDEAHGGQHTTSGRSMTKGEMNKREKIVKGMKKDKAGFKKRYGKDADAVMYATATKQAMKDGEVNEDPRTVGKALANLEYGKAMADAILKGKDTMRLIPMAQAYISGVDQTLEMLKGMYPKRAMEDGHTDVPSAIRNCTTIIEDAMQMKQKLETMQGELPSWMTQMIAVAASDLNDARDYLLNPTTESGIMYRAGVKKYGKKGMTAIQSAAGKGASHQEIGKIKDKYLKDAEDLEEGLKDWAKGLAMAGVLVAGMAGVGSIQDAIDRSVPAVQAMETALEMAKDAGNDELAAMIEKDLSAVKIRLSSGKDLGFVKGMQDKYGKFVKTEGLSYENTLRVNLESKIRSLK